MLPCSRQKLFWKANHYVLNGSKIFITNAEAADIFIVMAMTDKSKGTKGISAFIVERDFPGFSVGPHEKKMGIRGSSTCELIFENCIVPKENLLGKEWQRLCSCYEDSGWRTYRYRSTGFRSC